MTRARTTICGRTDHRGGLGTLLHAPFAGWTFVGPRPGSHS
ncbi:hypothetical protein Ae331Ps2_1194 [Pseudonocardia sp. Ae331_Ps2]|nr:hypothetical protein Ae331Ps2_1194 [Pseudonocardia sp. Ae331_Ps2]